RLAGLVKASDQLSADDLRQDVHNRTGTELGNANLQENTPLFYYILKEAELRVNDGRTLGTVGSIIVAQVLETALQADDKNYLRVFGADWNPPFWTRQNGRPGRVELISDIVKLVGDDTLLFGCQ